MKTHIKAVTILTVVVISLLFSISCSSSSNQIKPVKPDINQPDITEDIPPIQTERQASSLREDFYKYNKNLTFPPGDDLMLLDAQHHAEILSLHKELILYRLIYGHFPDSISTLVKSGFLLYWPRNPLDGKPSKCITDRELVKDRSDFGSFKYEIIDDDNIRFKFIRLDREIYEQKGEEVWVERSVDKGTKKLDPLGREIRLRYIMGATKFMDEIANYDVNKKLLYAMCANFDRMVFSKGDFYYSMLEEIPSSFTDVLFSTRFIIKENFESFARMLKDSGADYKWGFDRAKNTVYIVLDIDGERFISMCGRYGEREGSSGNTGLHTDCNKNELDRSSPIITDDNITETEIPVEYLISIKDIPLSEG